MAATLSDTRPLLLSDKSPIQLEKTVHDRFDPIFDSTFA